MKFWVPLICLPTEQYLPLARAAERLGYEGALVADHLAVPEAFASVHPSGENPFTHETEFPDAVAVIASLAAVTTRLRFMTYAYVLPLRDPFTVAKQFGTLSVLSGGRVALGAAVGWLAEEFTTVGVDFRTRGARTDEMLAIAADFWTDGRAEHHGRFHDFGPAGMFPAPDAPLPVLIAGKSDKALARAARHDGWLGMNYGFDEIEERVTRLAAIRRAAGDTRPDFEVFAIPNALPEPATYKRLAELGVTATAAMPWLPGDPATASADAKIAALEAFAATHL